MLDVQSEEANPGGRGSATPLPRGKVPFNIERHKRVWDGKLIFFLQPYHDPMDEPTAPQLDPSFFDFDNGTPLSKEELKGTSFVLFFACVVIDSSVELIYEEVTRPLAVA